jgi:hypothetical protein
VRLHWGIENDLFGSLDIHWKEDCRAWCYKGEGVLNQSYLRLLAYNICQIIRRRGGKKIAWPSWYEVFHWIMQALIISFPKWVLQEEKLKA